MGSEVPSENERHQGERQADDSGAPAADPVGKQSEYRAEE